MPKVTREMVVGAFVVVGVMILWNKVIAPAINAPSL